MVIVFRVKFGAAKYIRTYNREVVGYADKYI